MTRARDVANLIGSGNYSSTTFTATAGQTAFTISHTQGFIQVFMNGLLLDETVDYTSNGSAVTLTSGAAAGDEIEVVAYNTFSVGDAITQTAADARYYTQSAADTRYVNTTGDTVTGALTVDTSTTTNLTVDSANYGGIQFKAAGTNTGYITSFTGATEAMYIGGADTVNIHTGTNHGLTNGTTRLQIDASGRVTMPYQPSFGAYNGTGANAANITFANTFFNIGNHFNASTGTFTCPVAGRYLFTWNGLHGQSPTSYARVNFKINGSQSTLYGDSLTSDGNGIYVATSIDGIFNLSANDTVVLYNEGNTTYGVQYNMFSGCLLG